ncbi:MAG: conserved rane protein of unknown function [Gammaproteobacteria bacterium]|jgi:cytochrome b561|nr:conserved rane protein of unknown function [Gammaproteobacteria bacterium]
MGLKNTNTGYGSLTRLLHSILMAAVIGMLLCATIFDIIPKTLLGTVVNLHKLTGVSIFFIGIFFMLWSLVNIKPAYPEAMPVYERYLARAVHLGLYAALLAMPLSGWIMATAAGRPPHLGSIMLPCPFIGFNENVAKKMFEIHGLIAWSLAALIVLHALGALKHHFIDKNNILQRMF